MGKVTYLLSMDFTDLSSKFLHQGEVVKGVDQGDGWIKILQNAATTTAASPTTRTASIANLPPAYALTTPSSTLSPEGLYSRRELFPNKGFMIPSKLSK